MASSNVHKIAYQNLHQPALIIGGCSAIVAVILSTALIRQHLVSYTDPSEQKWIVAVLFMVPVYACQSFISLLNSKFSLACDILRSCYEAFALYSFGSYLVACLGGERRVVELLDNESRKQTEKPLLEGTDEDQNMQHKSFKHFFLHPSLLGRDLLTIENFGLVQYMILKTFCALLAFVLEIFGVYGAGDFDWHYGYPYIAVILNFSQMWALYCLVQFYNVTHERLQGIKPLAKFISFKAIVFATWWQGLALSLLCYMGVLPNADKLQIGLQDFLICIEMAVAAIAHIFVFSADPYHYPSSARKRNTTESEFKLEEGDVDKRAQLEETETNVESPTTKISESVHDIVIDGGHRVVKDVVMTISQAIGPVEKGVNKIQEKLHQRSVASEKKKRSKSLQVEENHAGTESSS